MKYNLLFICLFIALFTNAQVPVHYYASAFNKKGYELRLALHSIIKDHTSLTYGGLWDAFGSTDRHPDNEKIWDIYSDNPNGNTAYYFSFGDDQCGESYSAEGDCYNREHSIPKSWYGGFSPMYTDLFHIYPTDGYVNGKRGNYPLGEVANATWTSTNGSKLGPCSDSEYSDIVFEPHAAYKGDLARSYFYCSVCYMDKDLGQDSKSMFSGSSLKPWALEMLMRWHHEDPVSQKEINRNNAIYGIQDNRNPFIDYPELVDMIFGSDSVTAFNPTGVDDWDMSVRCHVYPNPAREQVSILLPFGIFEPVTFFLLNMMGQVMWQETQKPSDIYSLDISSLPKGVYFLHAKSDAHSFYQKIIVQSKK